MVATQKLFTLAAALAAGALVSAGAAQAATSLYWGGNASGTAGNWSTSSLDTPWATSSAGSTGTAWTDGDNANFQNGGTDNVTVVGTIGATTQVPTITVNDSTTADLLGSGTVNVSGNGVSTGLAGAANSILVIDGPTVNFTGALRQAKANLTVEGSSTVNVASRLSAGVPGWIGNFSGGTANIDTVGTGYGLRLGDDNFNYSSSGGNTGGGQLSATITQSTGSAVTIGNLGLQIGSGSPAGTAATDTYTLKGGSLSTTDLQIAARGAGEIAKFDLAGGTITVSNATPTTANGNGLVFGTAVGTGSSATLNFDTSLSGNGTSGILILKDATNTNTPWTFATLTGIANAAIDVNGSAATNTDLLFSSGGTVPAGYTQIQASVATPEPATLGLLALGGVSLLGLKRRRA